MRFQRGVARTYPGPPAVPVVEPVTVLGAPLVGLVTGLAAGLYPAVRAARIEPVEALHRQLGPAGLPRA